MNLFYSFCSENSLASSALEGRRKGLREGDLGCLWKARGNCCLHVVSIDMFSSGTGQLLEGGPKASGGSRRCPLGGGCYAVYAPLCVSTRNGFVVGPLVLIVRMF